jgi:hypothetical protein
LDLLVGDIAKDLTSKSTSGIFEPEDTPDLEEAIPLGLGSGPLDVDKAEHLRVILLGLSEKLKGFYLLK